VIGNEERRAGSSLSAANAQTQLRPAHQSQPQLAQTQPESLVRRVAP
jgi:hypothetical protein